MESKKFPGSERETGQPDMLAVLNHEVRTPMNGILGMLGLLLESELSANQRSLALAASESANQLFKLLQNILEVSRIEAGPQQERHQVFDLFRPIEEAIRAQTHALARRGILITTSYSGTAHAMVSGDPSAIQQVLCNLIDAALSGTRHQRLQIDIDLEARTELRVRLCVRIFGTDTGTRRHTGAAIDHGGDLRLHLLRRLLIDMGGQTGVEKFPQTGDRHWFTLDLPAVASPMHGIRLLFVEADPDRRSDRHAHLSACGLRADAVADPAAALLALGRALEQNDPYRFIILEQSMQEIDGESIGKMIAADPAHHASCLVMLSPAASTAGATALTAQRLADAGFSAWLQSPLTTQTLLSTLAQLAVPVAPHTLRPFLTNVIPDTHSGDRMPFTGYRVLTVDDDHINLQLIRHILESFGCEVETCVNGKEAVLMQREKNFDLIFMDCLMPTLDGYQATAQIRSGEGPAKHTPVIAITACTLPEEQEECYRAGMDDVVTKPIELAQIHNALVRWLQPASNDALESVRDLFGDDFIELAQLFQSDSPKRLLALRRAVTAGDAGAITHIAHTLSGSTVSIGATNLSTLCRELEKHCRNGALDQVEARLRAIEDEYARVDRRLRAMVLGMASKAGPTSAAQTLPSS